jgi:hypothetical protein
MVARTIVTSHPDVECDVCGRRLLRGEQPDVFLGGGQRRTVCELCTPRATHEGWRRETEVSAARPRSDRPQRGRSLLERFRQTRPPRAADLEGAERAGLQSATPIEAEWTSIDREWSEVEEGQADWAGAEEGWDTAAAPLNEEAPPDTAGHGADMGGADIGGGDLTDMSVRRALEVFNAGEHPRRVAGVARALGTPSVRAAPAADAGATVSVVVAWELCWYRYQVDLGDEARGAWLVAEGMELEELPAEDRVANAAADERGALSLLAV